MKKKNGGTGATAPAYNNGSILVTRVDGIQVIAPERELEARDVDALQEAFEFARRQPGAVVLDLDGHGSISSAAVAVIARWNGWFAMADRTFAVSSSAPFVRFLFQQLKTDVRIRLHTDLSSAVSTIHPGHRTPIGQILVEKFGLAHRELIRALKMQMREGGLLGQILLTQRIVAPMQLAKALALQGTPA